MELTLEEVNELFNNIDNRLVKQLSLDLLNSMILNNGNIIYNRYSVIPFNLFDSLNNDISIKHYTLMNLNKYLYKVIYKITNNIFYDENFDYDYMLIYSTDLPKFELLLNIYRNGFVSNKVKVLDKIHIPSIELTDAQWENLIRYMYFNSNVTNVKFDNLLSELDLHEGYTTWIERSSTESWKYCVSGDNGKLELTEGELIDLLNENN